MTRPSHPKPTPETGTLRIRFTAYALIISAYLLGGLSLLLFACFLYFGPFGIIHLPLGDAGKLGVDFLLSFMFFILHSGMIRIRFRNWMGRYVEPVYHGAIYTVSSGFCLLLVVLLWQSTSPTFLSVPDKMRWLCRVPFFLACCGFFWGVNALGAFDLTGTRPILDRLHSRKRESIADLNVRGPYRWVRHPLYLFSIIMFWSNPGTTGDRLFFNLAWTLWVVIGTVLEERDLIVFFGSAYREYQHKVPMLIPRTIRPIWK